MMQVLQTHTQSEIPKSEMLWFIETWISLKDCRSAAIFIQMVFETQTETCLKAIIIFHYSVCNDTEIYIFL